MIKAYPSLFLLCFVIGGIVAADKLQLSPYPPLILAVICIIAAAIVLIRGQKGAAGILLGLSIGLVSAFSFSMRFSASGPNHLGNLLVEPTVCQVYGQVADWPALKPGRTEIVVAVDSLRATGSNGEFRRVTVGAVLLKVTDTSTALQRGDRIAFRGRLYPMKAGAQAGFDYGRFQNLKGIFAQVFLPTLLNVRVDHRAQIGYLGFVDGLRNAIRASLDRNLSADASALARGFLIGETRDIPPNIYSMFRDSGTLHLLAVSGSNVALVLLFFIFILLPFRPGPGARSLILLAVITIFAGLSYGDPSVMRASIMAAFVIGARLLRRSYDLNNIVAVTALLILLVDPAQLFDVGFQLSFVTAWGLIFAVPYVTSFFKRWHNRFWYRWLAFPLIITFVAQVCSTPVVVYYFGRIPIISLLANLVVVPMVSLGVLGILLLLVADLILPLLGAFVGSLLDLWLNGVIKVLTVMGGENIPVWHTGALLAGAQGQLLSVAAYIVLILLVLSLRHKLARRLSIVFLLLMVNIGLSFGVAGAFTTPACSIDVMSVPGGVAMLARFEADQPADLIITRLTRRSYQLDEKVLNPWLERLGVKRLRNIFLLSADYETLDDLLRVASATGAATLYVSSKLGPSLVDARAVMGEGAEAIELVYFGGTAEGSELPGYSLSSNRIALNLGRTRIELVDKIGADQLESITDRPPTILVIGSRWQPTAAIWTRLHRSGFSQIICSKIEQPDRQGWPDSELSPDQQPPDFITDLSAVGSVSLTLPL